MTVEVTVELDQGSPLVTKRAVSPAGALALQAEADRLRAAAHPGVVELVESDPDGDGWVLRTAHAGPTLGTDRHLSVDRAAALVAALAETVADLHDLGIVHGRITAAHVVVGPRGRPRLCGLGTGAGPNGEAPGPADDVAALGHLLAQLVGVDGEAEPIPERRWGRHRRWVGVTRRALLTLADQACADVPSRRPSARRLARAIVDAVPEARLAPLDGTDPAALVTAGPVSIGPRPDPRQRLQALLAAGLATELRPEPAPARTGDAPHAMAGSDGAAGAPGTDPADAAAPATAGPDRRRTDLPPTTPSPTRVGAPAVLHRGAHRGTPARSWLRSPGGLTSAAAVGALVLLSAGLYHLDRGAPAPGPAAPASRAADEQPVASAPDLPAPDPLAGRLPVTDRAPLDAAPRVEPEQALRPGCPPAAGPDLDGDGCPDPIRIDGAEVIVGDRRFVAGEPGDVVVVGDWACTGTATPAVLRPGTGEVFVFPAWPAQGEDVVVSVTGAVPGAVSLHARPGPEGCTVLEAATADGTTVVVETQG
jgi:eukaryotic-like serine/threonine-protein kinase